MFIRQSTRKHLWLVLFCATFFFSGSENSVAVENYLCHGNLHSLHAWGTTFRSPFSQVIDKIN